MLDNRNFLSTAASVMVCVVLCGCSSTKTMPSKPQAAAKVVSNAGVEQQLIKAAQSIEHSLGTLALTQKPHHSNALNTAPLITPEGGMGGKASIDWTGPIEALVRNLAKLTDYEVKVMGKEPAIPVIVSITQKRAVIADILKNAALQAGHHANVVVFPAQRLIEIRYKTL